jgi:3-oxoacyl-[acyl-carrier-protein] synthase-3
MNNSRGAVITGWGSALPDKTITNYDLAARLDTSHEWILERTGISERRVGGTTAGLATEAGLAAIAKAGLTAADIDHVILCTTTPDQTIPASAVTVQNNLGIVGGAFDLNAACSGFVYGLTVAHGLIGLGANRILLIGAETLSRVTDWEDRGTAILFADGAAAVIVEACDGPGQLLSWDLQANGALQPILYADVGDVMKMEGREVFRQAVRIMIDSATKTMAAAGIKAEDLKLLVAHQANIRIIEAACSRLGVPIEKTSNVLHYTGNPSAASIPLALSRALDDQRLERGDLVLLVGFGAGMTAASAVLRWGGS